MLVASVAVAAACAAAADSLTQSIPCSNCVAWNRRHAPVHIHGDTYYVGTEGLSSLVVRTSAGLVLFDGELPQSVARIEANLRELGLRVQDIRLILVTHEHFDHVGGVAALQRDSGARLLASPAAAQALAAGHPTPEDPQAADPLAHYAPAQVTGVLGDGEVVTLGDTTFTAHLTPGHTPGSTSWTWRSCAGADCVQIAYVDSLAPISSPGFHFGADGTHEDRTAGFRASIAKVAALPCDILLTPHPDASGFWERVAARSQRQATDPLLDSGACKRYAARADKALDQRMRAEHDGPAEILR